jgi:hypothetical protein
MYEQITSAINRFKKALLAVGEAAQAYVDSHDKYLEAVEVDAAIIKKKMKEKIARVIDEE